MQTQAFPPPYQGERDDIPLAAIKNPFAQYVTNYNLDTGVPTLRRGDSVWFNDLVNTSQFFMSVDTYGTSTAQQMFATFVDSGPNIRISDVSTAGTATLVRTVAGVTTTDVATVFFNNRLIYFFKSAVTPQDYDGAAWGASGYTFSANFNPFGGTTYKNRGYYISLGAGLAGSAKYCYTEIDAIAGATTDVDLSTLISKSAYLYGIRSISLSEGIQQETVLAFIFNTGEVLVYSGSYPNSSNWAIVGKFLISEPVDFHPFIDARGDSFVITRANLVSLRTLFTQGVDVATQKGLSAPIPNRWRQVIQLNPPGNTQNIKGIYDPLNDRLIISTWSAYDHSGVPIAGTFFRLIYSFKSQSWYEAYGFQNVGNKGLCYYKDAIYFCPNNYRSIVKVEGASVYADEQINDNPPVGFPFQLRTAPLYTENFGTNSTVGIECLSTTDLHAETQYKLIANLGQQETVPQVLPNQGTGVQNPYINIGINANYLQLDISGTSSAASVLGAQFFAFNLWSEKGGVR